MVKDILREIKANLFQFIALTLITMLGVGFFVGIQVTGYDMRQTANTYMEEKSVFDYNLKHPLGIDEPMIDDIGSIIGGSLSPVLEDDMFARGGKLDDVLKVFEYNDSTKNDLSLLEGRLPNNANEVVIDYVMKDLFDIRLNDTIKLSKHQVFKSTEVTVVGFVESTLFMNLERGQSQLGVGKVVGFVYGLDLPLVNDDVVFTSLRISGAKVDDVKRALEMKSDDISNDRLNRLLKPERDKLKKAQSQLNDNKSVAFKEIANAKSEIESGERELEQAYNELERGINALAGTTLTGSFENRLDVVKSNHKQIKTLLETGIANLEARIAESDNEIIKETLQSQLDEAVSELEAVNEEYESGIKQVESGIQTYNYNKEKLETGRLEILEKEKQVINEFEKAQNTIDQAQKELESQEAGELMIFDREDTIIGYREFYDDSNRIEKIGKVFPIIFFFVSILVTLSTVTRLIEKNRMEMGVYKALGYSSLRTSMKYIMFSALSWLLGSLLGLYFGFYFIPGIIYDAYRIMYQTPELVDGIVMSYAVVPLGLSFISSVVVTFVKSYGVSRERTANLLRPVPPKGGQRIFLEKISFIWERLSFLYKVSFRNLFRNKTRFLMTILGVGGTTGLLIVGFGLSHSIYSIVDKQFDEVIQYDGLIYYDTLDFEKDSFTDSVDLYVEGVKIEGHEVSIYSAENLNHLGNFITMADRKRSELLDYDETDVILSEKIARLLRVQVGDDLEIRVDNRTVKLSVDAITENYANHFIYMSQDRLEEALGYRPSTNMMLFKTDVEDHGKLAKDIMENDGVLAIQFLDEIASTYKDMMQNFDVVIWVVVISALALEVLVLVNLISMNMSEREKELATLKVLGFKKQELATYVLRENIILTLMASIFGFLFGKLLHYFVITQAEIDMVMFNYELRLFSYIGAFALTMGISIVTNFLMARRANRVNMSEALKTFDE